jgi:hypothetical protein
MRQLVLIHGRAQEHKDSVALKAEWLEALTEGLAKSGRTLPIAGSDVRFPYYGETLFDLVDGRSSANAAAVVVRGPGADREEERFMRAVLEEVRQERLTPEQFEATAGGPVVQRGALNWEWVHGILQAVDRFVPYGSGASIALATKDVYQYLKNDAVRAEIDDGVAQAFTAGRESVVVSHSLGTVVAYHLLSTQGAAQGWQVPQFITLGSPLGVTEIQKTVKALVGPLRCPPVARAWFNAMDHRDVVALYPLTPGRFPLSPAAPGIENKTDVRNRTANRHGIAGYLDDADVAARIHDALTA